jgi:hypothetical protein
MVIQVDRLERTERPSSRKRVANDVLTENFYLQTAVRS